jgi:nucleotidyltransferase substrate binding protein (TIGR01987 family)
MTKLALLRQQFQTALLRFEEVLAQPKTDIIRDASIKRFEFTFDLAWRTIRAFLDERYGLLCHSPKACFREAYHQGLIEYDDVWIQMTDWRNRIVHEYSQDFADELYTKLPGLCELFKHLDRKFGVDA